MEFDSKCDFAPPTILLGLLLCPWNTYRLAGASPPLDGHSHSCSSTARPPLHITLDLRLQHGDRTSERLISDQFTPWWNLHCLPYNLHPSVIFEKTRRFKKKKKLKKPFITTFGKSISKRSIWGPPWLSSSCPVVKTLPSNAGGAGSTPGLGTKIPHRSGPKNQDLKQKQCWNKFNKDFKNGPHQKSFLEKREVFQPCLPSANFY